jgi:hypothetical protein
LSDTLDGAASFFSAQEPDTPAIRGNVMTEHPILAPIELTDAELDAVSGGQDTSQSIRQSAEVLQQGGNVSAFNALVVVAVEAQVAVIPQVANNINVSPTIIV